MAQERKGTFRDTIDNAFDISKWLLDLHGFIPIVAPITVGYNIKWLQNSFYKEGLLHTFYGGLGFQFQ